MDYLSLEWMLEMSISCHCGVERCISIVPIFNHLEEYQMDEIMQVVRSVSFEKVKLFTGKEISLILYILFIAAKSGFIVFRIW